MSCAYVVDGGEARLLHRIVYWKEVNNTLITWSNEDPNLVLLGHLMK